MGSMRCMSIGSHTGPPSRVGRSAGTGRQPPYGRSNALPFLVAADSPFRRRPCFLRGFIQINGMTPKRPGSSQPLSFIHLAVSFGVPANGNALYPYPQPPCVRQSSVRADTPEQRQGQLEGCRDHGGDRHGRVAGHPDLARFQRSGFRGAGSDGAGTGGTLIGVTRRRFRMGYFRLGAVSLPA